MPRKVLDFRQFRLRQERAAMKAGTDSMLLGSWAPVENVRHVLDIGTGTGVLALMLAQRAAGAQVDAVELDPEAAAEARQNAMESPFAERIRVFAGRIQAFTPQTSYDLIVCNPPFFPHDAGRLSPIPARRYARHDLALSPAELMDNAARLLAESGNFALVLPTEREREYRVEARRNGLWIQHRLIVRSRVYKSPHRACWSLGRDRLSPVESEILLHDEADTHFYSAAFRRLTGAFFRY